MILQEMLLTVKVSWLDPENTDKPKRRVSVREKLIRLFSHEFAEATTDQHGVKIELVAVDGQQVMPDREIKEPEVVSSSDNTR